MGVGLLIIEDYVPVVELVDTPDLCSGVLRGVWVRVPPGALAARRFLHFPLPLTLRSCYDGWDAVRRVSSIWQNTSLVNWVLGVRVPHPAQVLTVARDRATVRTNKEN